MKVNIKVNIEESENDYIAKERDNLIYKNEHGQLYSNDNLDWLSNNQEKYKDKIKMIYIDPPYNTRNNNFAYSDNLSHSNWLSFMYPRLKLAKELLTEDGVIFVSIDDNEQAYLKILMEEVFGRENFVGDMIRKTKSTTNNVKSGFNMQHENTLIFAKNKSKVFLQGSKKNFENYNNTDNDTRGDWVNEDPSAPTVKGVNMQHENTLIFAKNKSKVFLQCSKKNFENYKNPDNDTRGDWISDNPSAPTGSYFEIKNPHTGKIDLPPKNRHWRFSFSSFQEHVKSGKIKFKENHKESERGFIFKRYKEAVRSEFNSLNSLELCDNKYMNQAGAKERNKLFVETDFMYPKPTNLLKKLIQSSTNSNDLILDFFAGLGTTGQAVMDLNKEDGGNRKFILVQIPEDLSKYKKHRKGNKELGYIKGDYILDSMDNKILEEIQASSYNFCKNNNLKPTICSLTQERLIRAYDKTK